MTDDTGTIHTRTITVATREVGGDTLIVEGELRDDRMCRSFVYTAQQFVDPGVIHHMKVTFELGLPGPVIRSARADMVAVPNEMCREAAAVIRNMEGLAIRPGFTQRTNELIGGTRGCIHLTNLVHATASAAVQGQWAFYLRKRDGDAIELPSFDSSLLVNSCWLWREDGPHLKRIREIEEARRKRTATPASHRRAQDGTSREKRPMSDREEKKEGLVITIDGPGGAGKSTVAKRVAGELAYTCLDTGALYRAIAFKVLKSGASRSDAAALAALCAKTEISFQPGKGGMTIFVDGENVTAKIRTEEVSECASTISAVPAVRAALLSLQREAGKKGCIVAEGRDMGTVVFPDADVKCYLDAAPGTRAERRHKELLRRGAPADRAEVENNLARRDLQDSRRDASPLKPPEGAVIIDTTDMTIDMVVGEIMKEIQRTKALPRRHK